LPKGGYKPGGGRPPGVRSAPRAPRDDELGEPLAAAAPGEARVARPGRKAKPENLSPLEYMIRVMNDPNADWARRDRMAMAAAPLIHKTTEKGKKEIAAEKADEAAGAFETPQPPRLISSRE
jgi:hypothetical protein